VMVTLGAKDDPILFMSEAEAKEMFDTAPAGAMQRLVDQGMVVRKMEVELLKLDGMIKRAKLLCQGSEVWTTL